MTAHIHKLAIFGVGLIGGSVALALKQAAAVGEVVGVGRSRANLDAALKLGIIDRIATTAADAVQDADVVLLAVPVGQMAVLMLEIAPHLGAETIVTDAGSTKQDVAALMQQHLAAHLPNCVPGHPIAGAETCGAAAARADLYQGRNVILTPLPQWNKAALEKVRALWQACGAKISEMPATQHDAIFATVSHLPHLLAYTLVDMIARRDNADTLFSFAASGFRDFTRIAGSSPEMWRDIALANRQALLNEIEQYQASLEQMRIALTAEDAAALEATFKRAQTARVRWSEE
ncbi:prephenate dehydrogenase [Sulfuriferula sp. GW1]|uniref:prephenate dehydrogenase n=1 Tax=Sulfuriferula sp. GW1 TaxID=3345111 RepID=UPI0039B01352